MNVARNTDADFSERLREVTAPSSLFDPVIESRTRAIIDGVRQSGNEALIEFTERFDGAKLDATRLEVSTSEKFNASVGADDLTRGFSVVQELDELRCGWLLGVGVVRVAAVTKLTERRRSPEEPDAPSIRVELLMDMPGEHEPHRPTVDDSLQVSGIGHPARRVSAR